MNENEKALFTGKLRATLELYDKFPTEDSLAIWWDDLSIYPLPMVAEAIRRYRASENGKFAPKPSDIIAILRQDNRPGADEAWAMIPHDDAKTVVWTDEMSEALSIANPLILSGDMIAARMAFKDAYGRLVIEARSNNKQIRWSVCLGFDKNLRNEPIQAALRLGRIKHDYAISLLPPEGIQTLEDLASKVAENLRIENKSEPEIVKVKKHVDDLKRMVKQPSSGDGGSIPILNPYRQWAVKLAQREYAGDELPIISQKSWREALNFQPDISAFDACSAIKQFQSAEPMAA